MLSITPISSSSVNRTALWHEHHVGVPAVTFGLPFCWGVDGRDDGTANDDEANVACKATAPRCDTWLYFRNANTTELDRDIDELHMREWPGRVTRYTTVPSKCLVGEQERKCSMSSSPPMGTHQGMTSCWKMYSAKAFSSGVSSVR